MKTSILISSIAALCLLLTFAESPRHLSENKLRSASPDNISVVTVERPIMLPGVVITADIKNKTAIALWAFHTEDFSALKFDVTKYMEVCDINLNETEILPEAIETDYSYLKFNISDYTSESALTSVETNEFPVNENNTNAVSSLVPVANEFENLRFDVNDYIKNSITESPESGEMPLAESK